MEAVNIGNGLMLEDGPLVADRRLDIAEGFVSNAVSEGAELQLRWTSSKFWFILSADLLANVPDSAQVMTEEPFAQSRQLQLLQVLTKLLSVNSSFGFADTSPEAQKQGGFKNRNWEWYVAINSLHIHSVETPFGGLKNSGYGYEGGIEGLEAFLATKYSSEVYT